MKKIKILFGILCIVAISITGCQTDSVSETPEEQADFEITKRATAENNETVVKYNYTYNGERFSVNHTVDNESGEVLRTEGDTDRATSMFASEEGPGAILFSNLEDRGDIGDPADTALTTEDPSYVELDVQLFDTVEEMEAEVERTSGGGRLPTGDEAQVSGGESCTSAQSWGYGRFYYYKHKNYNSEMTGLRRYNRSYFRNHWVGSSYNDQMSSLIALKPYNRYIYTKLYQHSCFNGKVIGFYQGRYRGYGFGIRNLKWYKLSGWLWWRTSWNDQVSSIKGYSS
jgi:hypothetical protein